MKLRSTTFTVTTTMSLAGALMAGLPAFAADPLPGSTVTITDDSGDVSIPAKDIVAANLAAGPEGFTGFLQFAEPFGSGAADVNADVAGTDCKLRLHLDTTAQSFTTRTLLNCPQPQGGTEATLHVVADGNRLDFSSSFRGLSAAVTSGSRFTGITATSQVSSGLPVADTASSDDALQIPPGITAAVDDPADTLDSGSDIRTIRLSATEQGLEASATTGQAPARNRTFSISFDGAGQSCNSGISINTGAPTSASYNLSCIENSTVSTNLEASGVDLRTAWALAPYSATSRDVQCRQNVQLQTGTSSAKLADGSNISLDTVDARQTAALTALC